VDFDDIFVLMRYSHKVREVSVTVPWSGLRVIIEATQLCKVSFRLRRWLSSGL
jgi:hypothetical protein